MFSPLLDAMAASQLSFQGQSPAADARRERERYSPPKEELVKTGCRCTATGNRGAIRRGGGAGRENRVCFLERDGTRRSCDTNAIRAIAAAAVAGLTRRAAKLVVTGGRLPVRKHNQPTRSQRCLSEADDGGAASGFVSSVNKMPIDWSAGESFTAEENLNIKFFWELHQILFHNLPQKPTAGQVPLNSLQVTDLYNIISAYFISSEGKLMSKKERFNTCVYAVTNEVTPPVCYAVVNSPDGFQGRL
ncbi:hypothetical protein F2P81_019579 [Scophthalmus maximus]|uniref:Uncharacterized protein n=1 Tax=Scophthalmus maximus TaxID=52904 RepID=A0A6A4SD23_SCOMX|nr:hypothetical protein F2P81_019579 [Scophthalmus maximus]